MKEYLLALDQAINVSDPDNSEKLLEWKKEMTPELGVQGAWGLSSSLLKNDIYRVVYGDGRIYPLTFNRIHWHMSEDEISEKYFPLPPTIQDLQDYVIRVEASQFETKLSEGRYSEKCSICSLDIRKGYSYRYSMKAARGVGVLICYSCQEGLR